MNLKYINSEDERSESMMWCPRNFSNLSTVDNAMRAMRLREYGISSESEAEIKSRLSLVMEAPIIPDFHLKKSVAT